MMSPTDARYCAAMRRSEITHLCWEVAFNVAMMLLICTLCAWCAATMIMAREAATLVLLLPVTIIGSRAVVSLHKARQVYSQIKRNRELIDMYESWASEEHDEHTVR